jgi:hypothetical protein
MYRHLAGNEVIPTELCQEHAGALWTRRPSRLPQEYSSSASPHGLFVHACQLKPGTRCTLTHVSKPTGWEM